MRLIKIILSIIFVLGGFCCQSATYNVVDYGAAGDAQNYYVNTTTGSTIITTTNVFDSSIINKSIEIFGCGKTTYGADSYASALKSMGIVGSTPNFVGIITNIVNGTNVQCVALPPYTTNITFQSIVSQDATNIGFGIIGIPGAAPKVYEQIDTNHQDLIATITNVVNGTNLYLSVFPQDGTTSYPPQISSNGLWSTIGTDNTSIINGLISGDVASDTNATIYFPNGTYLCLATRYTNNFQGYGLASILLYRGGLTFEGESQSGTTLLSRGAWQSYSGTYPFRGFLFEVSSPITNNYPLTIRDITLDGGVTRGNLPIHGIQANTVDGLGWDQQHSAYLTRDSGNNTGTINEQIFTNVSVLHWRGESFKSIDGNTNGAIDIENCFFGDICATALNVYPRWNVRDNVFSNCWQITEYYQQYYRGNAYFCNNFITNDDITFPTGYFGNPISINGGIHTAGPLLIQSNTVHAGNYGYNIFICTPAANVSFLDNTIDAAGYNIIFNIGPAGSQGTDPSTNIVISGNSVTCGNKITALVEIGGTGISTISGLTVASNYVHSGIQVQNAILNYGGTYTNVIFENNNFDAPETGFSLNSYYPSLPLNGMVLVNTNNTYNGVHIYYTSTGTTNLLPVYKGPIHLIGQGGWPTAVYLETAYSNSFPSGMWCEVDNSQNSSHTNIVVFPDESLTPGTETNLPYGDKVNYNWSFTENKWLATNLMKEVPDQPLTPTNFPAVYLFRKN